jgi:hypothetical protein
MNSVWIEYRSFFMSLKKKGAIPSRWDELSQRQFIAVSNSVIGNTPGLDLISVLTGFKSNLIKKLCPYHLLKITEQVEFLSNVTSLCDTFFIKKLPDLKLYAPKPKLEGFTFGQFIFADSYFNSYQSKPDVTTLYRLVASLYTSPKQIFSNDSIWNNVGDISNLKPHIIQAIFFNYGLVTHWLQQCYPLIFQSSFDKQEDEDPEKESARASQWPKLFESLIGEDLINRDRYADLPVHVVFRYLTEKFKAASQNSSKFV